jgi:hypothetical protein
MITNTRRESGPHSNSNSKSSQRRNRPPQLAASLLEHVIQAFATGLFLVLVDQLEATTQQFKPQLSFGFRPDLAGPWQAFQQTAYDGINIGRIAAAITAATATINFLALRIGYRKVDAETGDEVDSLPTRLP